MIQQWLKSLPVMEMLYHSCAAGNVAAAKWPIHF